MGQIAGEPLRTHEPGQVILEGLLGRAVKAADVRHSRCVAGGGLGTAALLAAAAGPGSCLLGAQAWLSEARS